MSDIVERLREDAIDHFEEAKQWDQAPEQTCNWQRGLNANEAAYKIVALRTDNATLRAALKAHGDEAAKLVENRAAIAELVAVLKGYVDPGCGCIVCADAAAAIAKHEPKP